jgi:two-component system sensor histidine kinase KdpD
MGVAPPPVTLSSQTPDRRAEDFLELVERSKRGRLKLYIGFAAGVGKTYRMLQEAHALKARAVDIVVAFVETHGRLETEALVAGLEVVPRRRIEYRGVEIEEMSLNNVLKRDPDVVIVDEIAHTNVPGSRNRKRYQDVMELLDAGINVVGAFNVQHLESLKDIVEKFAGIPIRETVPDSFIRLADQIVNLDLAVDDLQERLRSGKIYQPDKIPWALSHFFQEQNLTRLRELALREVAESVERNSEARVDSADRRLSEATGNQRRVMVCLSAGAPSGDVLIRKGSRLAGRFSGDWFVVFVETPSEAPDQIDSESQRNLMGNSDLARELGAEVVRLRSKDPVDAVLDFARSHRVGHLVVGRSRRSLLQQWLGRSFPMRLVRDASGLDVHVVATDDGEPAP